MSADATTASNTPKPMTMADVKNKVCMIAIDGWGDSDATKGNAVRAADTPVMDGFAQGKDGALYGRVRAHGLDVGLPDGVMGNSEVGHLTLGAGRVNFQDLVRINLSLSDGSFQTNKQTLSVLERAKSSNGRIHFLGLGSDAGVHSHLNHLNAFLDMCRAADVPESFVHFFADGRDTPPTSCPKYLQMVADHCAQNNKKNGDGGDGHTNVARLATVVGRYYAMDRDKRWERVKLAYQALCCSGDDADKVKAFAHEVVPLYAADDAAANTSADIASLLAAVSQQHADGVNDEFLKPIVTDVAGRIRDGDTLVFIDFRADRMREIVQCFGVEPQFDLDDGCCAAGAGGPDKLVVAQMTRYAASFPASMPILFPPQTMDNGISEWVSKHSLPQFHSAETEKYAHVTFFFNGGIEAAFPLEERDMCASPKVATYDMQPEMAAKEVGESVAGALAQNKYPFVVCNFAPPDMVGHTGMYEQTRTAVAATDAAIGVIAAACQQHGYVLVVTSDHGNAEEMLQPDGSPKTSHSCNLVPLVVVPRAGQTLAWSPAVSGACDADEIKSSDGGSGGSGVVTVGGLADVAPTTLRLMGLSQPDDMTGTPLVV